MIKITAEYLESQGLNRTLPERFWAKVIKTKTCWIWTGCRNQFGYGQINRGGQNIPAHRASWLLHFGPIPEGKDVLHNCPGRDNPACVRPAHLWLGTDADNQSDSVKKGTHRSLRPEAFAPKLNWAQVDEIRERFEGKYGEVSRLAREYGISRQTIYLIIWWRAWNPRFHP